MEATVSNREEPEILPPEPKPGTKGVRPKNAPNGRKPGATNKTSRILKEAILLAAEAVGENGRGKNGLMGFLVAQAKKTKNEPFMALLGRVLPYTIAADPDKPFHHHVTVELVEPQRREHNPDTMPPPRPAPTAAQRAGADAVSTKKHPVPLTGMNGALRIASRRAIAGKLD